MTARQMLLLSAAGLALAAAPALAQTIPQAPADVAKPGGKIPGNPKVSLVKVTDGFNDPVGVAVANDGSGRIFVVERVGRVKVVGADGKVQAEPFLDLTKTNPLGSEVQTGFVEQGLWSIAFHPELQGQWTGVRPLRVAAVQRRVDRRPLHRRQGEPEPDHHRPGQQVGEGDHEHPAAVLQPLRRPDRVRARRHAVHRQGRCRMGRRSARRRPAHGRAVGQDAAHRRQYG